MASLTYSALERMNGSMAPAETVDQSACIWHLQHDDLREVELLTWQLASPQSKHLKDLSGSCKSYDLSLEVSEYHFPHVEIGQIHQ